MNKFLGYTEIDVEGGKIPIKVGAWTIEKFCESFGIGLAELGTLFETRTVKDAEGNERSVDIPKDGFKFFARLFLYGANYAARLQGKPEYSIEQAYEWVDELGLQSEQLIKVTTMFFQSIQNGGTPVKSAPDEKKSEEVNP